MDLSIALQGLTTIQTVTVQRSGKTNNGYTWDVSFTNTVGALTEVLQISSNTLVGTGVALTVDVTQAGVLPDNYGNVIVDNLIEELPPKYIIRNLSPGVEYYVRVSGERFSISFIYFTSSLCNS